MKFISQPFFIVGVIGVALSGCNSSSVETSETTAKSPSPSQAVKPTPLFVAQGNLRSPEDDYWHKEHPGWYEKQLEQDCPSAPQDKPALKAVLQAHNGNRKQDVFGEEDPFHRKPDVINGFKSRPNPHGAGIIVSAYKDCQRGADYSRRRSVWIIFKNTVYPLNVDAALNVGVLFGSPPAKVLNRFGLNDNAKETLIEQLCFEEFESVRKFSGDSPFPSCQ